MSNSFQVQVTATISVDELNDTLCGNNCNFTLEQPTRSSVKLCGLFMEFCHESRNPGVYIRCRSCMTATKQLEEGVK